MACWSLLVGVYSILSTIPRVVSNIYYLSVISWQVNLYNDTYGFLSKTIFVEDCWSVMGNRSLNVCGVQGE